MSPEDALAALGFEAGATIVESLGGSDVSESWRVAFADYRQCVLRIDTAVAQRLRLDRARELDILRALEGRELAPRIVTSDAAGGLLLLEWIEGDAWSPAGFRRDGNIERLASLLRRVHAVEPPAGPAVLPAAIERYRRAVAGAADVRSRELLTDLERMGDEPLVLCHCDPTGSNVIDDGHRLTLIDWEYAGPAPAWFDLAVAAGYHDLDDELSDRLLAAYFGRADRDARASLSRWRSFYKDLEALWTQAAGGLAAKPRT